MLTQLNPCIPMTIINKGKGFAVAVIDYSQEHDLLWVVVTDEGGEIWCVPNSLVRVQANWSLLRTKPALPAPEKWTVDPATGKKEVYAGQ